MEIVSKYRDTSYIFTKCSGDTPILTINCTDDAPDTFIFSNNCTGVAPILLVIFIAILRYFDKYRHRWYSDTILSADTYICNKDHVYYLRIYMQ